MASEQLWSHLIDLDEFSVCLRISLSILAADSWLVVHVCPLSMARLCPFPAFVCVSTSSLVSGITEFVRNVNYIRDNWFLLYNVTLQNQA